MIVPVDLPHDVTCSTPCALLLFELKLILGSLAISSTDGLRGKMKQTFPAAVFIV